MQVSVLNDLKTIESARLESFRRTLVVGQHARASYCDEGFEVPSDS